MTKKHKVLIPMELYAPRWNVLKVNIVHHHELIKRVETKDEIRYHKRAIFQQIEELKRYDYMWDAVMPTEERKLLIKTLNN